MGNGFVCLTPESYELLRELQRKNYLSREGNKIVAMANGRISKNTDKGGDVNEENRRSDCWRF